MSLLDEASLNKRGALVDPQQPALGKLLAGLARRETAPCRIAFAGSSTTAGNNATSPAKQYVNRLIAALQAAYPSGLGTETAVTASTTATWGTLSTSAGVHGYNAGEAGTNAGTYLTSGEMTNIAALNPAAVIHMTGSNDFHDGIPVATYKANVQAAINGIKAAMTNPCVHILVQPYERFDTFTPVAPWSAYGAALAGIAAADPANVAFIDISAAYYPLGIPGADPLDLIDTDSIHQNDAGHSFMAELLSRALGAPGPRQAAPVAATTSTTVSRITSDGPTGADSPNLIGRTSDALLGGTGKVWVGDANALALTSGAIVKGSPAAVWFGGWSEPVADVELSFVLGAFPTGGALTVDVHRAAATGAGTPDAYRLEVTSGARLMKRVAGTATYLSPSSSIAVGDRLAIRYYRGSLVMRINGTTTASVADTSLPAKGSAGFSGISTLAGFSLTGVTLDVVT